MLVLEKCSHLGGTTGIAVGSLTAAGTRFQFRNDDDIPLEIVIATFPRWPGVSEVIQCEGEWAPNV